MFDHWLTQDLLVVGGFALVLFLLRAGAKNERWQRAWVRMKRDRTGLIALGVVLLYLTLGALETIRIPGGTGTRSIIDLMTGGVALEKSYSAPLAEVLLDSTRDHTRIRQHLL